MSLARLLGIGRYLLPSLKGLPHTNHNNVRQISADIDNIVLETLTTPDQQAFASPRCPECGHGSSMHGGYCSVEFIQTDSNGIKRKVQCFCLMQPADIALN